jgi:hypothetical protein
MKRKWSNSRTSPILYGKQYEKEKERRKGETRKEKEEKRKYK